MIKLIENYSDYIPKDDATYAEGTFVDFAKSVKRYIKSEQMKGRFNGWDVENYIVPEIDRSTKEIRTDSFSLVFTKDKKNMFYIETFMKPDFFTTTITCPILGIKDEPVDHCNGESSELFYNGGFNSHSGFGSMLSNYIRPTMKDIDAEFGTFSESKRVRSKRTVKESSDYVTRKKIASNIASWAFGSFNMNDIDDNIDFLINRWFKSKSESFKSRMYMSETYEELAYVLADCDLNTLKAVERGLCIDDDSINAETDYIRSLGEAVTKKIPYDLVSSFVILRDYADVDDSYVTDEHRNLVDIADSIYNADISVSDMSKKYQDVYKKYGKAYFDKVLKDIRAIDSQIDNTSINDLVAEVNDKLSAF